MNVLNNAKEHEPSYNDIFRIKRDKFENSKCFPMDPNNLSNNKFNTPGIKNLTAL